MPILRRVVPFCPFSSAWTPSTAAGRHRRVKYFGACSGDHSDCSPVRCACRGRARITACALQVLHQLGTWPVGYWRRTDEGSDPYGELIQVGWSALLTQYIRLQAERVTVRGKGRTLPAQLPTIPASSFPDGRAPGGKYKRCADTSTVADVHCGRGRRCARAAAGWWRARCCPRACCMTIYLRPQSHPTVPRCRWCDPRVHECSDARRLSTFWGHAPSLLLVAAIFGTLARSVICVSTSVSTRFRFECLCYGLTTQLMLHMVSNS